MTTRVWGLTGGIGMGKSTVAQMFRQAGVPVFDADACVHGLLGAGGAAVAPVLRAFPDIVTGPSGGIPRGALRDRIFKNPVNRKTLESILHPLVRQAELDFIHHHQIQNTPLIILEIPLLYETGAEKLCDSVMVVTATPDIQRSRVLARPGLTPEMMKDILSVQMPDADKRARADIIIHTDVPIDDLQRQIDDWLKTERLS